MDKKLLKKFNNKNSILVISSYPEKGVKYSGKVCAVGGYTKNTLLALKESYSKENRSKKFIVLTINTDSEKLYQEDGILIWRLFKRNNLLSYFKLIQAIKGFNKVSDVLFEFEFGSFGGVLITALFPIISLWLKFSKRNITLVLHQIVSDLSSLSGHLGWKKQSYKVILYSIFLKIFLFTLVASSKKTIVLEEFLKKRLVQMIGLKNKITLIPHGVDTTIKSFSKKKARSKLGFKENETVLLYFGYLNWYKGVDFLIKTFTKSNFEKPIRLVIAGGESTTQNDKAHYKKFVSNVYKLAEKSDRISLTGFVNEKDIPLYFSAADLLILPYRTFMSSSGPLSLAYSFKKPFIISDSLKPYLESLDFNSALQSSELSEKDLFFTLDSKSLNLKINKALNENLGKLTNFSEKLKRQRSFSAIAPYYRNILDSAKASHRPVKLEKPSQVILSPAFQTVTPISE